MTEEYDVTTMELYNDFCIENNYAEDTLRKYKNTLNNYCNFHKKTLEELIEEAEHEEETIPYLKKRKIKKRLTSFRNYLNNEKKFSAWTVKTNVMCVKSFYKYHEITLPTIKLTNLNDSDNESIGIKDLPDMNTIRTAIESTKKIKHKALFLFSACTGSARNELCTFTFKQFLEGVLPYCPTAETPKDIIKSLDGRCEELEVIPVFKMKRHKTNTYYYTAITPECTQFMINYLKSEGQDLKDDDRFFKLGKHGVSAAFDLVNKKFNWGKRGNYAFFSSHRVRKFNASKIKDMDFGDYIQGRTTTATRRAYYKIDIEDVRKKYKEHMGKFTVYARYNLQINSEAYEKLENENKELHDKLEKTIKDYETEIEKLRNENQDMKTDMGSIQNQIDNIANANDLTKIQEYIVNNELVNKYNLSSIIIDFYKEDIKKDNFEGVTESYIDDLIMIAYNRVKAKKITAHVEIYDDENWKEIQKDIELVYRDYMWNLDLEMTDGLKNKLDNKLEEYSKELWLNKSKVDENKVVEIIDSVLLR